MTDIVYRRTEPIETEHAAPNGGTTLPVTEMADDDSDPFRDWNRWLRNNLLHERDLLLDGLAEALWLSIKPLEKKLDALEVKATELGKIGSVRAKGLVELERELKEAFDRKTREVSEAFSDKVRELTDIFHGLQVRVAEIAGVTTALRIGRALNFRDGYDATQTYDMFDVVMLDGSSFVAITDRPGPCPASGDWRLLASCG